MVIGVVLYVLTRRTAAATPNGGGESRMTATPNGGGDPGRRRMEAAAIPVSGEWRRRRSRSAANGGGGERRRGGFLGRRRQARRAQGEAEGELWRSRPSAEAPDSGGEGCEADWPHGGQAVAAIPNGGGDPERRRRRSRSGEVGTERRPRDGGRWLRRGCHEMGEVGVDRRPCEGRTRELAGWVDVPWVGKDTAAPSSDCRRERRRRRLARSDRWTAAPGSIGS
jgi:hypothetical protein